MATCLLANALCLSSNSLAFPQLPSHDIGQSGQLLSRPSPWPENNDNTQWAQVNFKYLDRQKNKTYRSNGSCLVICSKQILHLCLCSLASGTFFCRRRICNCCKFKTAKKNMSITYVPSTKPVSENIEMMIVLTRSFLLHLCLSFLLCLGLSIGI